MQEQPNVDKASNSGAEHKEKNEMKGRGKKTEQVFRKHGMDGMEGNNGKKVMGKAPEEDSKEDSKILPVVAKKVS